MTDQRLKDDNEITEMLSMVRAAFMTGRVIAYAAEYRGAMVTVFGYAKTETDAVPLGIFLPNEEWADIPHFTDTHGPTKS